ncbi:MAG: M24 family metallopeptidase [Candidatus Kariarchaeaceae archaeon]|jgi:Xaa-Pro aminopeptidase
MGKAKSQWEQLNLIRREKFDIILPKVMRENKIDMWIHVMQEGNPDALTVDLGGDHGFFIFTDRGNNRIERAVLGGYEDTLQQIDVYDVFGKEEELQEFIAMRDPKLIAINTSEWIAVADGISHSKYLQLIKAIGTEYTERIISAGNLITDFRTQRVTSEIVLYGRLGEITRQLLERALSNEVIVPDKTTLEEVGWWMEEQLLDRGMKSTFSSSTPSIIYSEKAKKSEYRSDQYILQRGDLLQYDFGIHHLNFGTDMKRIAYILRKKEKNVPSEIQHGWNRALKAREVIRANIKLGITAGEALKNIGEALDGAGFDYIHLTTDPMICGLPSVEPDEKSSLSGITGVSIDCHCVGNTGNSEVASGPSIAGFRQDRAHLIIKRNNIFAFEFIAVTPVPEWGGKKVRFNIEDNAIVTENGVEWLYPPNERILLIH